MNLRFDTASNTATFTSPTISGMSYIVRLGGDVEAVTFELGMDTRETVRVGAVVTARRGVHFPDRWPGLIDEILIARDDCELFRTEIGALDPKVLENVRVESWLGRILCHRGTTDFFLVRYATATYPVSCKRKDFVVEASGNTITVP